MKKTLSLYAWEVIDLYTDAIRTFGIDKVSIVPVDV